MKKLVSVTDVEGEGMLGLLGQRITLFCMNYIYTGELEGVNATCVKLKDAAIVYETGDFSTKEWKDAQKLAPAVYVQIAAIESFMVLK
jgi:hypothetical protein